MLLAKTSANFRPGTSNDVKAELKGSSAVNRPYTQACSTINDNKSIKSALVTDYQGRNEIGGENEELNATKTTDGANGSFA